MAVGNYQHCIDKDRANNSSPKVILVFQNKNVDLFRQLIFPVHSLPFSDRYRCSFCTSISLLLSYFDECSLLFTWHAKSLCT
jgi:hypothetical protein